MIVFCKIIKHGLLLLGVSVVLVGCQSPVNLPLADYAPELAQKYPPVTVVVNNSILERYDTVPEIDPYRINILENKVIYETAGIDKDAVDLVMQVVPIDKLSAKSNDLSAPVHQPGKVVSTADVHEETRYQYTSKVGSIAPNIDPDMPIILNTLRSSGLFERVDISNAYAETILHINYSCDPTCSDLESGLKTAVSLGSMFCIPVRLDFRYCLKIEVRHMDQAMAFYEYQEDLCDWFTIFEKLDDDKERMIQVLFSRFYHDIQKDRLFETITEKTEKNPS